MELTPSMTAIVPGLGSLVAGADGEIGFDNGLRDWDASGLWAVCGADGIIISISVIGSCSEASFSAEIISGGYSSVPVSILAVTAVFTESSTSAFRGHTVAHNATQAVRIMLVIIFLIKNYLPLAT
jgi:hypothetical protein